MLLYMKQKMFSFKQDFDIFDENEQPVYHVDGEFLSFGRKLHIIDVASQKEVAFVKQRLLVLMPEVEVYVEGELVTNIRKKFTLFRQDYHLDQLGWRIEGNIFAHDYEIYDAENDWIASINKRFFALMDTYEININNEEVDPAMVIAVVLAIDTVMDNAQD